MGEPIVRRLMQAGYEVIIWNRTRSKMDPLICDGAKKADNPADVMRNADIVGLCLKDTAAVEEVSTGMNGLIDGAQGSQGKLVIDFTSMDPYIAKKLHNSARLEASLGWIDAPVSGGVPAAEQGTLIIFAGGESNDIERARPFFETIAQRVMHMGPSGTGQLTKLCNQLIVGVSFLAIAESFALARRAGIDVNNLAAALEGGFADSRPLQLFGPRMARHSFEPKQGGIDLMLKDLDTIQKIAKEAGAATPVSSLATALYRMVGTLPDGDMAADISTLIKIYES
jgi:3-hydroxyisobutyrate dehydrogenase